MLHDSALYEFTTDIDSATNIDISIIIIIIIITHTNA